MFNIGISEAIIIFIVAFLVVGPNDLPKIAKYIAKTIKKVKLVSEELKESINIEDEVKEINKIKSSINKEIDDFNPATDLKRETTEIFETVKSIENDVKK